MKFLTKQSLASFYGKYFQSRFSFLVQPNLTESHCRGSNETIFLYNGNLKRKLQDIRISKIITVFSLSLTFGEKYFTTGNSMNSWWNEFFFVQHQNRFYLFSLSFYFELSRVVARKRHSVSKKKLWRAVQLIFGCSSFPAQPMAVSVWTAEQLRLLSGEGTAVGITCAMPVDSTIKWTGQVDRLLSLREDW